MHFLTLLALATSSFALPSSKPQVPPNPTGVQTITTANNITIRYKEPGKEGICETTPGVKSYSGYVDLSPDSHTFFWFFEARHDPQNAPITLWLNGGPGSDSLIGLFDELGPCHINSSYQSYINPHSFNEVSNMLFLSQPLGVGFSYSDAELGSLNPATDIYEPPSFDGVQGRYPTMNPKKTGMPSVPVSKDYADSVDTTDAAAKAAWEVLQGFMGALPKLDSKIKSKNFNLWTESYGGNVSDGQFFNHFREQNEKIESGKVDGIALDFQSLGIINGIIDEAIQASYYPEFATKNTYGIKAVRFLPSTSIWYIGEALTTQVNETVYNYMKFANGMSNGCQDQVSLCKQTNRTSLVDHAICSEATNMCRDNVEGLYYEYSGRGPYDIRSPASKPPSPGYFNEYLKQNHVMNALGVNINYTNTSSLVTYAFQQSGDFVYPNFIDDLEALLALPVRISLIYGDADYICNWFGGEAVSLAAKHPHAAQFRDAGYVPMVVDGIEFGETREYGNFSFTRVYEAGHEVPYYQPVAALQLFNRTLNGWDVAEGVVKVDGGYGTDGLAKATHTESSVALPSATSH